MYWGDRHRFTNFQARRRQVLALRASLNRSHYAPASMIDCCQMEYAYQWSDKHTASYPLFYDNPEERVRDFVMVSCANETASGTCANTVQGGVFTGTAEVTLALPVVAGASPDTAQIHYSLDGSDPTTVYKGKPISISATTVVRATKAGSSQSRHVTFTKV